MGKKKLKEATKKASYMIKGLFSKVYFFRLYNGKLFDFGDQHCFLPSIKEIKVMKKHLEILEEIGQEKIDEYNNITQLALDERLKGAGGNSNNEKRPKREGYIYLLKSKKLYKLGRALKTRDRMKTYKTENPFGVKFILEKKVKDYVGVEKRLLDMFQDKQVRGEWFKLNPKDVSTIKKVLSFQK